MRRPFQRSLCCHRNILRVISKAHVTCWVITHCSLKMKSWFHQGHQWWEVYDCPLFSLFVFDFVFFFNPSLQLRVTSWLGLMVWKRNSVVKVAEEAGVGHVASKSLTSASLSLSSVLEQTAALHEKDLNSSHWIKLVFCLDRPMAESYFSSNSNLWESSQEVILTNWCQRHLSRPDILSE